MSDGSNGSAARRSTTTQELVDAAARSLAERADGRRADLGLGPRRAPGRRVRPRARRQRGRRVHRSCSSTRSTVTSKPTLAFAYIADAIADVGARVVGREEAWGVEPSAMAPAQPFVSRYRDPAFLESVADSLPSGGTGAAHLPEEFDLVRDSFHRFAADKIRPVAEHIHRSQRRHPRVDHRGHGRARRVRALGARGVRRVRGRRRVGLPRDVRRDRGALVGLARRGRRARSPGPRS